MLHILYLTDSSRHLSRVRAIHFLSCLVTPPSQGREQRDQSDHGAHADLQDPWKSKQSMKCAYDVISATNLGITMLSEDKSSREEGRKPSGWRGNVSRPLNCINLSCKHRNYKLEGATVTTHLYRTRAIGWDLTY